MKVLLICNYEPDRQHSMLRYAELMREALVEAGVDVRVLSPRARLTRWCSRASRGWRWFGYVDKFVFFAFDLAWEIRRFRRGGDGVIHLVDQGNGLLLPLFSHLPHVVTCHDLIAMKACAGRSLYQRLNRLALSRVQWMACVSEATRREACRWLGVATERCTVILNPLPPFFSEPAVGTPAALPSRYLLHVGSGSFYKNRPGLLAIYKELRAAGCDLPLVLMGEPLRPAEIDCLNAWGLGDGVQVVESPEDGQIRAAYASAEAFIFPSRDEGFGWPILEALAQGCLVFTHDQAPMTEVGGDSAVYIDADDSRAAARRILELLSDPQEKARRRQAGLRHAATFSMTRFSDEWCALYRRILNEAAAET